MPEPVRPRLPLVPGDAVEALADPEIEAYFRQSYALGTPPPTSLALYAHHPELLRAWCRFWWTAFHGGKVEHGFKERLRVRIAERIQCHY